MGLETTVTAVERVTALRNERAVLLAIAVNALMCLGYHDAIAVAIREARKA